MLLCCVVIENRMVVPNTRSDSNLQEFLLLQLYLFFLPNNMILHHCVISAVCLCVEAERVFSVYMDIGADGAPVGSH